MHRSRIYVRIVQDVSSQTGRLESFKTSERFKPFKSIPAHASMAKHEKRPVFKDRPLVKETVNL